MVDAEKREFKLALTIAEDDKTGVPGAHAVLALMGSTEDGIPILGIEAGGFSADAEGAAELSDMLRDAADAIDDHLKRDRPHHNVAEMAATPMKQPVRPRFNPQPRGQR